MTVKQKVIAGKALRQFIEENFINYSDFARSMGTLPATVTHWMTGRNPIPVRIVERLGVLFPDSLDKAQLRPDAYIDNAIML